MHTNDALLSPFWQKRFPSAWVLGLILIFLWGIPRFCMVLLANKTGSYQWVSLTFVSMWITPWIFLSRGGRRKIGMKWPDFPMWLVYSLILGALGCAILFLTATTLFEDTISNWFVYISNSYSNVPENLSESDRWIYFAIYAVISMIFSPIGEEIFYRGLIHECFATKWSEQTASIIDSVAFSITHLAHFGIVYHLGRWDFLPLPALLWMLLLFFTCLFFSLARRRSGSILGAIFAHAGFNVAMIYCIFFYII